MDNGLTPSQSADPFALTPAPAAESSVARRHGKTSSLSIPLGLELLAILVVQAALSLRLVHANTAYQGEATYLWAGHLEWAHWLHGAAIPQFSSYFSGAPVIYPPLGALADSLGGLVAARALSLVFMLGSTILLWSAAKRLFGRQAAFFAAGLFAVLGPTLHLGAFATYDALSVFLVALATWIVVRTGERPNATGWMIAAGAALALANASSYSTILFDVVVILVALLIALPELGGKQAAARCLTLLMVVVVLLLVGWLAGGASYAQGFRATLFGPVPGRASVFTVISDAWLWCGVVVVAALGGIVASWIRREGAPLTVLLAVLTAAALLGPFEQAQLHTATLLDKHIGLGCWFSAIAAGYAVDKLIAAVPAGSTRVITCGACVIALALPVSIGASQSDVFSTDWANATAFIRIFGPLVDHTTGRVLVEDPSIAEYYLPTSRQWERWSSTRNIVLPSGASTGGPSNSAGLSGPGNAGTYGEKIAAHYFSLVALNYADTTSLDHKITADLRANGHYCVIEVVPYGIEIAPIGIGDYVIWQYAPHFRHSSHGQGWNCP